MTSTSGPQQVIPAANSLEATVLQLMRDTGLAGQAGHASRTS
jgi:hypothetical protein